MHILLHRCVRACVYVYVYMGVCQEGGSASSKDRRWRLAKHTPRSIGEAYPKSSRSIPPPKSSGSVSSVVLVLVLVLLLLLLLLLRW